MKNLMKYTMSIMIALFCGICLAAKNDGKQKLGNIGSNQYVVTDETDPKFTQWFAGNPLSIYLTSESDPKFTSWLNTNPLNDFITTEQDPIFSKWESTKGYTYSNGKFTLFPNTNNFIWNANFTEFTYDPNGGLSNFYLGTESLGDILTNYVSFADIEKGIDFNTIIVKSLTIDGKKPSLDGHQHSVTEITNMPNYLTSHQDISGKADKTDLLGLASTNDITITGIKVNGQPTIPSNKVVDLTIPSVDTFVTTNQFNDTLTKYVLLDELQKGIEFNTITVSNLTINGKKPSVEGHKHTMADIEGLDPVSATEFAIYKKSIKDAAATACTSISNANDIVEIKNAMMNFLNTIK